MEIQGDFLVLLHSESQKSFVTDELSSVIKRNMDAFVAGKAVDYSIIAIGHSKAELEEKKQKLIAIREKNSL